MAGGGGGCRRVGEVPRAGGGGVGVGSRGGRASTYMLKLGSFLKKEYITGSA